ncbi:MAG: hypothetical protein GY941_00700 [Planctomycetes bacterium]|nr:hypothetical protein [Planctomycetota bacterium]
MVKQKGEVRSVCAVIIFSLMAALFLIPVSVFSEDVGTNIEGKPSEDKVGYDLSIKDGLISLNAKESSLGAIIDEIGKTMKIDVVGNVHEEERISVEFENLSLKDALEMLSLNYGYQMNTEANTEKREETNYEGQSQIAKIIVVPKERETRVDKLGKRGPFEFKFDPSKFLEKGD